MHRTLGLIVCLVLACAVPLHLHATVVINELMAVNDSTLQDEDGDFPDWIELYNVGPTTAFLNGWYLTDDVTNPSKWRFPNTNMAAGSYLLVFCSDKNRAVGGQPLHTSFKLTGDGEYVGLYAPDGVYVIDEITPAFPPLGDDMSYGRPGGVISSAFIQAGAPCRVHVPSDNSLGTSWMMPGFDDSSWTLGTTGVGYERGNGYDPWINTDVESVVYNINGSCYVRIPFVVENAAGVQNVTLRALYDDGFAAFINGQRATAANSTDWPAWNALATGSHEANSYESFDMIDALDALVDGTNILAIQAQNVSLTSSDYLILPEMDGYTDSGVMTNISTELEFPTPGTVNSGPYVPQVAPVEFSHEHGYYDAPFSVTLSCETAGATILYRTDFIEPTYSSGTPYSGPISVNGTMCLRVRAFKSGWRDSESTTRSYIFLNDVVSQSNNQSAKGFPSTWTTDDDYSRSADYEMDPDVIGPSDNYGGRFRATIKDDLQSIPALSIVLPIDDLFSQESGIYANPQSRGENWERTCSAEFFGRSPDTNGFQVNCGLRIHGEINRQPHRTKKHSLRLLFKKIHGPGKLRYQFFSRGSVDRIDTIVLRCMYGDSFYGNGAYCNDHFSKNCQLDCGHDSPASEYVHVYLNGLYWGLYDATERPDDNFHEEHVGGDSEQWDVVVGNIVTEHEYKEGTPDAYDAMMALAQGSSAFSDSEYAQLQQYLNIPQFCDYMIMNIWFQNWDWPSKNWQSAAMRGPVLGGEMAVKFRYYNWDCESIVGWWEQDRTTIASPGPARIYNRGRRTPKFQRVFGDRVHKHFFNGGALTPETSLANWTNCMNLIERAVVGESARWGDANSNPPKTQDDWYDSVNFDVTHWFPNRTGRVLEQFRNLGLYPSIDAPVFSQHGGDVPGGYNLTITADDGEIYYTTDWSDPGNENGSVGASAIHYTAPHALNKNTRIRARAKDGATWSALEEAVFIVGRPDLRVTELMYNPPNPPPASPYIDEDFEYIELANIGSAVVEVAHVTLTDGIEFNISNRMTEIGPGECIVIAHNLAAFATRYNTNDMLLLGGYEMNFANGGEHVELTDPLYGIVHDFTYDDAWYPSTDGMGYSLEIVNPLGTLERWDMQAGWRPSMQPFGTPGDVIIPEPAGALLAALSLFVLRSVRSVRSD